MTNEERNAMAGTQEQSGAAPCGCGTNDRSAGKAEVKRISPPAPEPRLQDLIPIAVVIAAGCESCAEKMVARALEQGSSLPHIEEALGVVAHLRKLDCLVEAVGTEIVTRMELPLAAGRRTLERAKARSRG